MQERFARMHVITAMFLCGTIVLFVRHIPLTSSVIPMVRSLTDVPFLLSVLTLRGRS